MLRLIAFFRKFRVFIVFALFQIIALTSYFSIMSFPRTRFFNTANAITGTLFSWERNINKYIYLDEVNTHLQKENALLQQKIPLNFISVDPKTAIINDTIYHLSYQYTPAKVINASYQFNDNYFTINAGSLKGIQRNMGVVSSKGVVGIVYDISKQYAVVRSILTSNINISAFIEGSHANGIIKHQNDDPLRVELTGISNDIKIKIGAKVKARGSAGYFPYGEPIGTVEKVESIEGKPLWNITVKLNQDMRTLHAVYVLHNIHQEELDSIQKKYYQP